VKHGQDAPERFRIPGPDVTLLRVRLITEEYAELVTALHQADIIKIMDACADLRYVVVGTAIAFGVPSLDLFGYEMGGKSDPRTDPSPAVKLTYISQLSAVVTSLNLSLFESINPLSFRDERELKHTLQQVIDEVLREVTYFDAMYAINGKNVFAEVHRSNMTKAKLDKHSKGGKITKKGFTPPNFEQFVWRPEVLKK